MDKRGNLPKHGNTGYTCKYNPDVHLQAVDDFIAGSWRDVEGQNWPSILGFCLQQKVSDQTLKNWCIKFPEWEEKYKLLKQFCEFHLLQGGLVENYNPGLVKFILSSRFEYAEKTIVENNLTVKNTPEATLESIEKLIGGSD